MNDEAQLQVAFVRFCLEQLAGRTAMLNWGQLYDTMCDVARRRLFRGLGYADLSANGLSLALHNISHLRRLSQSVWEDCPCPTTATSPTETTPAAARD